MGDMHYKEGYNTAPEFPGMGKVIDVCTMPEHHVPETEYHLGKPSGPTVEKPQTTKTGKSKGPEVSYKGANS